MINKKVDEAIFDALLEQAFSDVIDEDFKKLKEDAAPCTLSKETENKIRKIIAKAGKNNNRNLLKNVVRAASIVLVILLNLSLLGIIMVPSVNAEVKNVFSEFFEKYVSFETKEHPSLVVTTGEYEIEYIPSGFELVLSDDFHVLFRETDPGNCYISINISDEDFGHVSLDSENSSSQIIEINGKNAALSIINGEYHLFWFDGYHFITINTNIQESELIKIANGIKKYQILQ